jgi:hypothetical protein
MALKFRKILKDLSSKDREKYERKWAKLHIALMGKRFQPEPEYSLIVTYYKTRFEQLARLVGVLKPMYLRLVERVVSFARKHQKSPFTFNDLRQRLSPFNPRAGLAVLQRGLETGAATLGSTMNKQGREVWYWTVARPTALRVNGMEYVSYVMEAIEEALGIVRQDGAVKSTISGMNFWGNSFDLVMLKTPPSALRRPKEKALEDAINTIEELEKKEAMNPGKNVPPPDLTLV